MALVGPSGATGQASAAPPSGPAALLGDGVHEGRVVIIPAIFVVFGEALEQIDPGEDGFRLSLMSVNG
jgi:hypothetical protein